MEGGQKREIPLDSGLDVKSSDQLVPVERPLFQHNRQRFQGQTLPTSLRFEHNGFGAGWDVYEFEINYFSVETEPARFTVIRQQVNENPTYVFRLRIGTTTYAMVYWNGEDVVRAGDIEIAKDGGDLSVAVVTADNGGHRLELRIDMVTGEITYDDSEWFLIEGDWHSATAAGGQTDLSVLDLTSWVEFNAAVVLPTDAMYGETPVASYYSCVLKDGGHVHTWSDALSENKWLIEWNDATGEVTVNGQPAEAVLDMSNGKLAVTYNTSYEGKIGVDAKGEEFYLQVYGLSVSQPQQYVSPSATGEEDFEYWAAMTQGNTFLYPTGNARYCYVTGFVPFWSGIGIMITTGSGASALLTSEMATGCQPDDYSFLLANAYYVSNNGLYFYDSAVTGATIQVWNGDEEIQDAFNVSKNTFGTRYDVHGTLTCSACVFNRVRVAEDLMDDYAYGDYPFYNFAVTRSYLEINDDEDAGEIQAPWFNGGTFKSMLPTEDEPEGEERDFAAGFYVPMEERPQEEIHFEETGGGYMLVDFAGEGWPSGSEAEGYDGRYVSWAVYNSLLENAAGVARGNGGILLFVQGYGNYVSRDKDSRIEGYFPSGYDYVTVSEYNDAARQYNATLEEGEEGVPEISTGDYAVRQISKADTDYGRLSGEAWVISSAYVGAYQSDRYSDEEVINDIAAVQSEIIGYDEDTESDIYGEVSYSGYMRLGYPYAFYDAAVEMSSWTGTMYDWNAGVTTDAKGGQAGVDMAISIDRNTYSDPDSEITYYLGSGFASGTDRIGYLIPYFGGDYGNVEAGEDSRQLVNHSKNVGASGDSGSRFNEFSGTVSSGLLSGIKVSYTESATGLKEEEVEYIYKPGKDFIITDRLKKEYMEIAKEGLIPKIYDKIAELEAKGYIIQDDGLNSIVTEYAREGRPWGGTKGTNWLKSHAYTYITYYTTYTQSASISLGSKTLWKSSAGSYVTSDMTDTLKGFFGDWLLYACGYGGGFVSGTSLTKSSAAVNTTMYISACFKGKFQNEIRILDAPEDGASAITEANLPSLFQVSKSPDARLLSGGGLYIDRDIAQEVGTSGVVTLVGYDRLDVNLKEVSIDNSGLVAKMYLTPNFDEEAGEYGTYYVHRATVAGRTAYIPGNIYGGSIQNVATGMNLAATALGYTYVTSTMTFDVNADAVQFYKADSVSVSWPAAYGTHEFYSAALPAARQEMVSGEVFYGSPSAQEYGDVDMAENLNILFGGGNIRLRVDFDQADGNGTTSVSLLDLSGSSAAESVTVPYGGYDFTFRLSNSVWDTDGVDITLGVSVPLTYVFSMGVPYQYNFLETFGATEDGKYLIDGEEMEAVPVGTVATSFDPATRLYSFEASGGYLYYYNADTGEFTYGLTRFAPSKALDALSVFIEGYEYLEFKFILEGAYRTYKCTLAGFDDEYITLDYDGTRYRFHYSELMTGEEPVDMNFMFTDTRDPLPIPETRLFARQNFEKEYQFLRQAWETTHAVENFWWIDSETILELNKTSLTVKKKRLFEEFAEEATVDDWGGDFWEDAASFPRYEYLDNTVARYGVTCAYGGARPRFWTIKEASDTKLRLAFYDLVETDLGLSVSYSLEGVSLTVALKRISIGETLNSPSGLRLNTYSQLSVESVVYDSQFTSTVIGEHILFGIHNDNNFNQWALDISTTGELLQAVQGYGFVGIDGRLTGGEIPAAWFDPSIGFTGAVLPTSALEQEEDLDVSGPADFTAIDMEGVVVGDESQQWYVSKNVASVVSHLLWDEESGMWGVQALRLNNNVAQAYGSASFGANVVSERGIAYYNFMSEFVDSIDSSSIQAIVNAISKIGAVYMLYLTPRLTTMLYLQQTMGQYAYVHYNSPTPGKQVDQGRVNTSKESQRQWFGEGVRGEGYTAGGTATEYIGPNELDPVTPENQDDFSFNLHTIRQQVWIDKGWSGFNFALVYVMVQACLSIAEAIPTGVGMVVNGRGLKNSAKGAARQFTQVFAKNMDKLMSVDTNVMGMLPVQNSALTGVLTLDMFYSTGEGQKVQAGPGFVQHNFVAQCVAQSVTSNQMELKQSGIFVPLSELGTLVYKVAQLTLQYVADATLDSLAIWASGGDQYGVIGAAAFAAATVACVTKYAIKILLDIVDIVDKLFRSMTGGAPQARVLNTASKHFYDMEGKHKYGQKSEVFMWPCWGVTENIEYENESVSAVCENIPWTLAVPTGVDGELGGGDPETSGAVCGLEASTVTYNVGSDITLKFNGEVPFMVASCKGSTESAECPDDMAAVIGTESFLPPVPFKNENIGVESPIFAESVIQDYIIDKEWELSMTCSKGMIAWVACKDTKLIDGAYSNIVLDDGFCGVACPYTAIEIQRGYEQKYMRAWNPTPMALGINQSGLNAAYEEKAYHAFDGYGGRIVKWCGAPGMNKEGVAHQYAFIANDRFKRSNKVGANRFQGNFGGEPILALRTLGEDEVYNDVDMDGRRPMDFAGVAGEDKDGIRYSIPVFAETVSTLPAVVKTISSSNLAVVDGITGLITANRDAQGAYKAPVSIDFAIGKDKYRFTDEYICRLDVDPTYGVTTVEELVPTLGLTYLGATPYEAYLYSAATRQYYTYAGGTRLDVVDMLERFRDIIYGRYDFVNQEVVLPCVATFVRLDKHVFDDDDERDNTIAIRLKGGTVVGEVWPPIGTIYNMRSGFKTISLPSGLCFQGPNRCIINRFVYSGYMREQIKENAGQWKRVPRERYHPFRAYESEYEKVDENVLVQIVGWTHNPFLLVTSPLGVNSETDCVFEWEITFAWPVEMDDLYEEKQYACVNVMAETFTPGGKVIPDRPAHVFLYRDLFTRTGNYGYYSFRYQSRCGAGNRERLHIWSDQYIAVSGLQVEYKPITEKRTEILTQQVDVMDMEEI